MITKLSPALVMAALVITLAGSFNVRAKTSPEKMQGVITGVNAQKNEVMVKTSDNKEHTFMLNSSTELMNNGKKAKLSNLKEGETANITVENGKTTDLDAMNAKNKKS